MDNNIMQRFLPPLLLVLLFVGIFTFLPIRRELSYRLGIANDPTTSCCGDQVEATTGDFEESAKLAIFNGDVIDYPKTSLAEAQNADQTETQVLGTTNAAGQEKWIDVDLGKQWLRAYEGNQVVMQFPISSGKWSPTPIGTYFIWYKTRFQSMKGGSKELGTYYNLPNVPYNMFFHKGYAIHGAYWHNNFGQPMSHGCVNSPIGSAREVFDWAGPVLSPDKNAVKASPENPGTRVFVHS